MAKRLTNTQKEQLILLFKDGKTIEFLSEKFECTNLTIVRNLKKNLGEKGYKEFVDNRNITREGSKYEINKNSIKNNINNTNVANEVEYIEEYSNDQSNFFEIAPLDYEIENLPRKELSSVPISEIDFPKIVYMIVDNKIELKTKYLKDYPAWQFLPNDDLNRKTIEIYSDMKTAKRFCGKEQKVIKVPNTKVFQIVAPLLLSRGISRIVSDDLLIAL